MPLTYHPAPGSIVICDFATGFRAPEMVKTRPVVVISPRRRRGQLVTVVPLSSTAPEPVETWHYRLPPGAYPPARAPMWAKCDVVVTVALERLDRVKVRDADGRRTYRVFEVSDDDLAAIRAAVRAALGFD